MKTGFHNPIEPKGNTKKIKSPFNYDQPEYDERTSCYINSGSHYGIGHRQPVGHQGNPKSKVSTLPTDRRKVNTMKDDEIPYRNLFLEVDE